MRKQNRISKMLSTSVTVDKDYVKRNLHPKTDVEIADNVIDHLITRDKIQYPGEYDILDKFS